MTDDKMERYSRRLKQIGEHEIAEAMRKLWDAIKAKGCATCAYGDFMAAEQPCAMCIAHGKMRINWMWEANVKVEAKR